MKINEITYDLSRIKKNYIIHGKAYKRIPHQNLHTNPVLVPILGWVVFDSLRRQSSLVLLLQIKVGLPMMPNLGLSFSPLLAGDLVSRESQKTREFGVGGGKLKELGLPTKATDGIDFWDLQASDGIFNFVWEEHGEINLLSKFQPNRTVRSEDINISSPSVYGR